MNSGTTFTVTIISDEEVTQNDTKAKVGNWTYKCISNVTVTFSDETYTYNLTYLTDANVNVTITVPPIKNRTMFILTAKKSGYRDVSPMTLTIWPYDDFPGFELVLVITAILLVLFYIAQKRK